MNTSTHTGINERLESFKEIYEDKIKGILRSMSINEHENIHEMLDDYLIEPFCELPTVLYNKISATYKHEGTEHYTYLGLVQQETFDKEWFTRQMQHKLELQYHEDLIYIMNGEL